MESLLDYRTLTAIVAAFILLDMRFNLIRRLCLFIAGIWETYHLPPAMESPTATPWSIHCYGTRGLPFIQVVLCNSGNRIFLKHRPHCTGAGHVVCPRCNGCGIYDDEYERIMLQLSQEG